MTNVDQPHHIARVEPGSIRSAPSPWPSHRPWPSRPWPSLLLSCPPPSSAVCKAKHVSTTTRSLQMHLTCRVKQCFERQTEYQRGLCVSACTCVSLSLFKSAIRASVLLVHEFGCPCLCTQGCSCLCGCACACCEAATDPGGLLGGPLLLLLGELGHLLHLLLLLNLHHI